MAKIEKGEAQDIKLLIDSLSLEGTKQALKGMADLLVYKPSILNKIFMMFIEDALLYTKEKEGR